MNDYSYHSPQQPNYYGPSTPQTAPAYSPHYATTPTSRPSPRAHGRHASYTYATPRSAPLRPPPNFGHPASPQGARCQYSGYSSDEHVSHSARRPPPIPRFRTSAGPARVRERTVPSAYRYEDSCDYGHRYYPHPENHPSRVRSQMPDRHSTVETPTRPRAHSSSHATRQAPPQSPKPAKAKTTGPREVTDLDRKAHNIPKGFSTKYWNPDEEPILLLGSVFDANSIGRWIYDWTAYAHNPHTPIPQIAADLWLLLIKTAGKMKMARQALPRIRRESDREMVDDFVDSGERLMDERLARIIAKCEDYMLRRARRSSKEQQQQQQQQERVTLGKNSGVEFVECMFGRDRELINTEKLIHSLELWNKRYDANCEDIVKRPSR